MSVEPFRADQIEFEGWRFVILSSSQGVRKIDLRGTPPERLAERLGGKIVSGKNHAAVAQLSEYLSGERKSFSVPLDLRGSAFQLLVWEELSRVPYGKTISYGELAARIGRPQAARAVGAALGANPIPIIIPCHRVIGKDGALVGFGGGLDLKRRFLSLEKGNF